MSGYPFNQPCGAWVVDSSRAWLAAVGVGIGNGVAFGTAYTFGIFFDSMATEFDASRGSTALIFGITLLLFFGFGIVSGPLSDRVGPLPLLAAGAVLFVGGLFLTSLVNRVWLGYITYGLGVGLGSGFFVAPLTAAAGGLFVKRRAAALGLVAVGNGLGSMLLIPLAQWMIDEFGWRTAYRVLALVAAVAFLFALVTVLRPPPRPAASGTANAAPLSADPVFRSLFLSSLFMSLGLFTAFAFIVSFATDNGVSERTAALIFALIGLSSIVGRLGLSFLSGRIGAVRVYQLMLLFQPIAHAIWLVAGGSVGLLIAFALVLGTTYGGFVAITPEVGITLFGAENMGRMMGQLFLSFGIGGLIGPPIAGLLADNTGQRTVIGIVIAMVVIALALSTGMTRKPSVPLAAAELS